MRWLCARGQYNRSSRETLGAGCIQRSMILVYDHSLIPVILCAVFQSSLPLRVCAGVSNVLHGVVGCSSRLLGAGVRMQPPSRREAPRGARGSAADRVGETALIFWCLPLLLLLALVNSQFLLHLISASPADRTPWSQEGGAGAEAGNCRGFSHL